VVDRPLISSGVLVGFVILLTPRAPVDVNWEVLDLLKMAGRQAASYFARMQATEACSRPQVRCLQSHVGLRGA
jgi:GAF domain-containing protein